VLRAAAARLLPVTVDEQGLDPARLPSRARIVFVTPSHQFPTGTILPLTRWLALFDWAKRRDAVIVEKMVLARSHSTVAITCRCCMERLEVQSCSIVGTCSPLLAFVYFCTELFESRRLTTDQPWSS
jgi:hypothetical protein